MRRHRIKLNIKTEKQLNTLMPCSKCNSLHKYRDMYFYVDESNIAITNNAKPVCKKCKQNK